MLKHKYFVYVLQKLHDSLFFNISKKFYKKYCEIYFISFFRKEWFTESLIYIYKFLYNLIHII